MSLSWRVTGGLCSAAKRLWRGRRGFSLIEQVVAIALVAAVAGPLALLLAQVARGGSIAEAEVDMINIGRSQMESVKEQQYQDLPTSYSTIDDVPEFYTVTITAEAVKTYSYPSPSSDTLADEIQLITVEVSCPGCRPQAGPLTFEGHKVRR